MLCTYCGWGDHIQPACADYNKAVGCLLNQENLRKYYRRCPNDRDAMVVRSTRHQGPEGKGDSSEVLERVERITTEDR